MNADLSFNKLRICLSWNFAQANVKDLNQNIYLANIRNYLTKDYLDLVNLSSEIKHIKQTFVFVPSVLKQILDYTDNPDEFNAHDQDFILSRIPAEHLTDENKVYILMHFFRGNDDIIVLPYAHYAGLYERRNRLLLTSKLVWIINYFTVEDYRDLQVWHQLTWLSSSLQKEKTIKKLIKKGKKFTEKEKIDLLNFIQATVYRFIHLINNEYKKKKIEIAATPFYNPIMPLIISNQNVPLKSKKIHQTQSKFKAKELLTEQCLHARKYFKSVFNHSINGIITPSMAWSTKAAEIIARTRYKWTMVEARHVSHRIGGNEIFYPLKFNYNTENYDLTFFITHPELSEKILKLFPLYSAQEAFNAFMETIKEYRNALIEKNLPIDRAVLSLNLNVEQFFELFQDKTIDFLTLLYSELSSSLEFEMTTPSDYLKHFQAQKSINRINEHHEDNTFDEWIGVPAASRAWDKLAKTYEFAKSVFKDGEFSGETIAKIKRNIHLATSSDWFYAFSKETNKWDIYYDELFRSYLINVYESVYEKVPKDLFNFLKHNGDALLRSSPISQYIHPKIDGVESDVNEWKGASVYFVANQHVFISNRHFSSLNNISIGYSKTDLFIKLALDQFNIFNTYFSIDFHEPMDAELRIYPLQGFCELYRKNVMTENQCIFAIQTDIEIQIPFKDLNIEAESLISLQVTYHKRNELANRFPMYSVLKIKREAFA